MDRTIALIEKSHQGDPDARAQLVRDWSGVWQSDFFTGALRRRICFR